MTRSTIGTREEAAGSSTRGKYTLVTSGTFATMLAQVEARPARGRPDDGHSVGPGRERVSDAIDCPATDRTRWFRLRDRTVGRAAHRPDATGPVSPRRRRSRVSQKGRLS